MDFTRTMGEISDLREAQFLTECDVRVIHDDRPFLLLSDLVFYSALIGGTITVPKGYKTDFASIPWLLQSVVQVNGKHRRAAVIHDWMCDERERLEIPQKLIDQIFLEAMAVDDVRFSQRRVMFRAVRTYQTIKGWFS